MQPESQHIINNLRLNQDSTCFAIATDEGFRIFSTNPLKELINRDHCGIGELSIVEILDRTNIIAFVGSSNNLKFPKNKLVLWDDDLQRPVGDIQFPSDVLGFHIFRDKLAIALLSTTYLYDLQTLQLLQSVETYANPRGLCELNRTGTKAFVTLGPRQGTVRVCFPDQKNSPIKEIQAHEGAIQSMKLDKTGKLLATASDKGTIIRVFDLSRNDLQPNRILRRGLDPATISSITFDPTSKWLCVSSNTETIHIFGMESGQSTSNWTNYFKSFYTNEMSSLISLKLPRENEGMRSICCFNQQLNQLFAICDNGCYYQFSVDLTIATSDKNFDSFKPFLSEF